MTLSRRRSRSDDQVLAGDALWMRGLFEGVAELGFQHAVDAAHLLLFAQLQAVADHLRLAVLAMLSGDEVALFDGALFAVAALAFEKQFHALAPALPANRADIVPIYSPYFLSRAVYSRERPSSCFPIRDRLTRLSRLLKLFSSSAAGSHCAESA